MSPTKIVGVQRTIWNLFSADTPQEHKVTFELVCKRIYMLCVEMHSISLLSLVFWKYTDGYSRQNNNYNRK